MAKRFKLRISRIILSLQSCRSKDPSTLPDDPVPSFLRLPSPAAAAKPHPDLIIDVHFPHTPPPSPPHKPHRSSFKRHVSSAFISVGCGLGSNHGPHSSSSDHGHAESLSSSPSPQFKWQKEDKWHVVAKVHHDGGGFGDDATPRRKIYNTSASENDDVFPPLPAVAAMKKRRSKRKTRKSKTTPHRLRLSTSSADSGLFSSESWDDDDDKRDQEDETETLVSSSRSFSTECSSSSDSFNPQLETIRESTPISIKSKSKSKSKRGRKNRAKRGVSRISNSAAEAAEESELCAASPARLSVFRRMIPCGVVEGKVRESYAVVKRSEDPFGDFKRSMVEMIVEKEMVEESELEQLLQCFLSLNSTDHHGLIVEAFSQIWVAMFSGSSKTSSTTTTTRQIVSKNI